MDDKKYIKIFATGGTFDKEYDEINGELFFKETHLHELLSLGRSQLNVKIETLMMVDSLEMTKSEKQYIVEKCKSEKTDRIIITHGTDTMVETAKIIAEHVNDKTIILTGAMIPIKFGSSDGLIKERAAWFGPNIQNSSEWLIYLDEVELEEIHSALQSVKERNLSIPFNKEDFSLPTLSKKLTSLYDVLENQLGFVLLRGIDRDRYTDLECELIYWGIGLHLGRPVSQNTRGHLLGHVTDEGKKMSDPTTRLYQTTLKMDFHSDQLPVDVVGLFCQRKAKKGGASFLVSALTIHNVIREERPDLLDILHSPFNLDWRGENPEGEQPWYTCPMYSHFAGKLTSRLTSRAFFESVTRHGQHLALTDLQREALDVVQEIGERESLRLSMDFNEGDIQFINNHQILHAREDFIDHEDPKLKRHLLRMWISFPKEFRRALAPDLMERYSYVERGGIPKKEVA